MSYISELLMHTVKLGGSDTALAPCSIWSGVFTVLLSSSGWYVPPEAYSVRRCMTPHPS